MGSVNFNNSFSLSRSLFSLCLYYQFSGSGDEPTSMPEMPITYFTQYDAETPSTPPNNVRVRASRIPPQHHVTMVIMCTERVNERVDDESVMAVSESNDDDGHFLKCSEVF